METHKTRFCIDKLMKMCDQRLVGMYSCISPRSKASVFTNSVFKVTF